MRDNYLIVHWTEQDLAKAHWLVWDILLGAPISEIFDTDIVLGTWIKWDSWCRVFFAENNFLPSHISLMDFLLSSVYAHNKASRDGTYLSFGEIVDLYA